MNPGRMLCPLLVIVLATCIHEGLGIICWECRSDLDHQCGDPFDNSMVPLINCRIKDFHQLPGVKSTICTKTKQQMNGQLKISRGCGYLSEPDVGENKTCSTQTTPNIVTEYCTCNIDGCNSF